VNLGGWAKGVARLQRVNPAIAVNRAGWVLPILELYFLRLVQSLLYRFLCSGIGCEF
jgi:hypothetical protein